jgi:50S ribosomal protein L16 3-hydroxylase
MCDSIDLPGRYADPGLEAARHPAEIPRHLLDTVTDEMNKVRFTADDVTIFLGQYLSEPKHNVFFTPPAAPLAMGKFIQSASKRGIALSRKTQMLYRGKNVFINGESFSVGKADKAVLDQLANARALDGAAVAAASGDVMDALHTWYQDGWLELN